MNVSGNNLDNLLVMCSINHTYIKIQKTLILLMIKCNSSFDHEINYEQLQLIRLILLKEK